MLTHGNSTDCEKSPHFNNVSSGSSNSETVVQEDVSSLGNSIKKQWSAIERTLYDEEGEHVADPELLRECKLWKETFPHIRVRGTKIDTVDFSVATEQNEKNIQTVQNHISLNAIYKKREVIKNKVVGQLVERLIRKFSNFQDENLIKLKIAQENNLDTVKITEIDNTSTNAVPKLKTISPKKIISGNHSVLNGEVNVLTTEKESYFERGKAESAKKHNKDLSLEKVQERIYEIFDSWDDETDTPVTAKTEIKKDVKPTPLRNRNVVLKDLSPPKGEVIGFQPKGRIVPRRNRTPSADLLSNQVKPFELTKKIDKKYEGLLNRLMERKNNEAQDSKHCQSLRNTAKYSESNTLEPRTYQETMEKLRVLSGFDDTYKKNLPKINTLSRNHWLERGELHAYSTAAEDASYFKGLKQRNVNYHRGPRKTVVGSLTQQQLDEQFMRDLKKEMDVAYKRPAMRNSTIGEISLRRPKPVLPVQQIKREHKSSSCGDLPNKNKKISSNRQNKQAKCGFQDNNNKDVDGLRRRTKFTNSQSNNRQISGRRNGGNNNGSGILPPIESGIICKELTVRPRHESSKPLPKKR